MASRDVVVVGAGVIGCAVAYELARRGASVELVDMRTTGMGATQASAGVLAPYIEAGEGSALLDLTVRSLGLFDGMIANVARESGQTILYKRTGTLDVALDDGRLRKLAELAQALARLDVGAELLDASAVRAEEPYLSEAVLGGLFISTHGFVSATALTSALAIAARRRGAQIVERGAVRRIRRDGDSLVVETERGSLTGDGVVIAAGSWSAAIDLEGVEQRLPIRPVRGQLLQLAWVGSPLRRVTWAERCYLVPWEDGTVLVGATAEEAGFDERATAAGVHDLLEAAFEVVPHAWTAGFIGPRVGLRPASPDELPIIGPSDVLPNVMYATGHYRNGILLAPLTAALVADAMLDNRIDPMLSRTAPRRFGAL